MPRGPRVNVLDGLYHVIARGVERRDILRTDRDREDSLNRLAVVVEEEDLRLYSFAPGGPARSGATRRGCGQAKKLRASPRDRRKGRMEQTFPCRTDWSLVRVRPSVKGGRRLEVGRMNQAGPCPVSVGLADVRLSARDLPRVQDGEDPQGWIP